MKREYMVKDRNSYAVALFNTRAEALRWIMANGLRAVCHIEVI